MPEGLVENIFQQWVRTPQAVNHRLGPIEIFPLPLN
jgi:hypothetical protein